MANEVERTTAVITALTGSTPGTELLLRVANRFVSHWQREFDALIGVDEEGEPNVPTNQQKAGFFLLKMRAFGKDVLRAEAMASKRSTLASDITDAGDIAEADLE